MPRMWRHNGVFVMAKSPAETKNYTPQQIDFAMRYYLPTSPTYSNALQSALAAGFTDKYAKNITTKDLTWLENIMVDIVGKPTDKKNLLAKAKKVLDKSLGSDDAKLAQDTAKFVAATDPEFSNKTDITSAEKPIPLLGLNHADLIPKDDDGVSTDNSAKKDTETPQAS